MVPRVPTYLYVDISRTFWKIYDLVSCIIFGRKNCLLNDRIVPKSLVLLTSCSSHTYVRLTSADMIIVLKKQKSRKKNLIYFSVLITSTHCLLIFLSTFSKLDIKGKEEKSSPNFLQSSIAPQGVGVSLVTIEMLWGRGLEH